MTPEEIVARLNALAALDPCAVRTLLEARTPINPDLAREVPQPCLYRTEHGSYLRPLGLLNTVLSQCSITIAVRYDANGNPTGFEALRNPLESKAL